MTTTTNLKQLRQLAARRTWDGWSPTKSLQHVSDQIGAHGVERIEEPGGSYLLYVNLGDTDIPTICWDSKFSKFLIESWGGWLERKEDLYARQTGNIRCGHCSYWTPCEKEWRETVCESCGNLAGG